MRQQPLPYRIALGGTLASFCLLFLFITGVLPMFYLIMPMLCSLLILIMAETTSPYWAFITPNKDASLIFILFFGHYPLLRPYLSRIRPGILRILIKLLIFNLCIGCYFGLVIFLFGMAEFLDNLGEFGKYGAYILAGCLNVMFLSYDFSLVTGMEFYRVKVLPKLHLQV